MRRHTRPESLSEQVIRAVAEHRGVDPQDLAEPLYAAIDPEALDHLFADNVTGGVRELQFRYHGHLVTIESDRTITVSDEI